jgi:hypothetical protein
MVCWGIIISVINENRESVIVVVRPSCYQAYKVVTAGVVSATATLLGVAGASFLGSNVVCVGSGAGVGARDVVQEGVGEEVSEVRRPRSLMVSLTGFGGSG